MKTQNNEDYTVQQFVADSILFYQNMNSAHLEKVKFNGALNILADNLEDICIRCKDQIARSDLDAALGLLELLIAAQDNTLDADEYAIGKYEIDQLARAKAAFGYKK